MNIEDLIRDANPVKTSDLAGGDSPHARRALARILDAHADPGSAAGQARHRILADADADGVASVLAGGAATGRSWWARRVNRAVLMAAGLACAATAAAVAVVAWAAFGPAPGTAPGTEPAPPVHPRTAQLMTAREILLAAAANVARAPATGRYWRVREINGITFPAGTKATPYDISLATSFDQWNPSSAGRKEWTISRQLGARPATPADTAAWRAAGSPTKWHSGQPGYRTDGWLAGYPFDWVNGLAASTTAAPPSAAWQVSDGTVGYVEGDEPGLNAAQFRRMPTLPWLVEARLRHYARLTPCGRHPVGPCATVDQLVWAEALALLQDPVSAQVRSATFEVMAALPGIRLLGPMTDPLGRRGYGLAAGAEEQHYGHFNPTRVAIIDPRSGSLLATEDITPMPRTLQCLAFDTAVVNGRSVLKCVGSSYYGRSYQGQVDDYIAVVSEGWTNASPALPPPSTWQGPTGFPGLPPAS